MKAIRVSAYGDPSVLKLEETPIPTTGARSGTRQEPRRGRESGRHISQGKHRQPRAEATLHTRLRRRRRRRGGRSRGQRSEGGRSRLCGRDGNGCLRGAVAVCAPPLIHPLAGPVTFTQGAAMNVPYATAYHALFNRGHGQAGGSFWCTGPAEAWHRRGPAGAGPRSHGDRDGRDRTRPAARRSSKERPSCPRPHRAELPQGSNGRSRRGKVQTSSWRCWPT